MKSKMVKDADIRPVLIKYLNSQHASEQNYLIIEELGLCQGTARIDIAVINGSLNGYEIKSEKDTLKRLAQQQEIYNKIFDSITLVTSNNHLKQATKMIPGWWGISEIILEEGKLKVHELRSPKQNKNSNPSYLVQLLWRDEALEILKERDLHKGFLSKTRGVLWDRLIEYLSFDELRSEIRKKIKSRRNWRPDL